MQKTIQKECAVQLRVDMLCMYDRLFSNLFLRRRSLKRHHAALQWPLARQRSSSRLPCLAAARRGSPECRAAVARAPASDAPAAPPAESEQAGLHRSPGPVQSKAPAVPAAESGQAAVPACHVPVEMCLVDTLQMAVRHWAMIVAASTWTALERAVTSTAQAGNVLAALPPSLRHTLEAARLPATGKRNAGGHAHTGTPVGRAQMDFSEALQALREAVRHAERRHAHHASGLLRIEARHALAAEAAAGRADKVQGQGCMDKWKHDLRAASCMQLLCFACATCMHACRQAVWLMACHRCRRCVVRAHCGGCSTLAGRQYLRFNMGG